MEQPIQDRQNPLPSPPPPMRKLPLVKAPLIGFLIFACLVASAAAIYKLTGQTPAGETPSVLTPTAMPLSPTPDQATQKPGIFIYALRDGTATFFASYVPDSPTSFGISTPVFDDEKYLYYLMQNNIYQYDLEKKTPELFARINHTPGNHLLQLRFLKPDTLAVAEAVEGSAYRKETGKSAGNKMHIINVTNKESRVVHDLLNVVYGGNTLFMETPTGDVIGSFGGDACSGWGNIHLYKDTTPTLLSKTGLGTSSDPHFVGELSNMHSLLFFAVLPESVQSDGCPYFPPDVLYLQNVVTDEKKPLLDLKPFVGFKKILIHDSEEKIAITTDKEIHIYNLLTNATEKIIQHNLPDFTFDVFGEDFLIAQNHNGKSVIMNTTNEQYTEYTWQELIEDEKVYPRFLGEYQDNLLFLKIVYEN